MNFAATWVSPACSQQQPSECMKAPRGHADCLTAAPPRPPALRGPLCAPTTDRKRFIKTVPHTVSPRLPLSPWGPWWRERRRHGINISVPTRGEERERERERESESESETDREREREKGGSSIWWLTEERRVWDTYQMTVGSDDTGRAHGSFHSLDRRDGSSHSDNAWLTGQGFCLCLCYF